MGMIDFPRAVFFLNLLCDVVWVLAEAPQVRKLPPFAGVGVNAASAFRAGVFPEETER